MSNFNLTTRLLTGLLLAAPLTAAADSPARSMLVLDGSGSMWGQIDGRSKIEIAREAVDGMLANWRGGELGLMAYGHRRKGDCADIEQLAPIAALEPDTLRAQVAGIHPRGMTPIGAAVRQAAQALRYTESKATVILVSDGEETCEADPCAMAEELEALGVDFTAHVIGFDIRDGSSAQAQLQCLATRTGGRYLDAANAQDLSEALESVAEASATRVSAVESGSWLPGYALESEVGVYMNPDGEESAGHLDLEVGQTAQDCKQRCDAESSCAGWHYEPAGSFFIEHPRCSLKGDRFAVRLRAEGEGWVAGIKPGVRLVLDETSLQDAASE